MRAQHGYFADEWYRQFQRSVREAAQHSFTVAAGAPVHEVYHVLAEQLRRGGVDPEPDAVFTGVRLISQRRRPAVLRDCEGTDAGGAPPGGGG